MCTKKNLLKKSLKKTKSKSVIDYSTKQRYHKWGEEIEVLINDDRKKIKE
jgi:hypothetical protein